MKNIFFQLRALFVFLWAVVLVNAVEFLNHFTVYWLPLYRGCSLASCTLSLPSVGISPGQEGLCFETTVKTN